MKIILLKDVAKVGRKYEIKDTADGYAGFLISSKSAVQATPNNIKAFLSNKQADDKKREYDVKNLQSRLDELSSHSFKINAKANEQGHLFASVNKDGIIKAVKDQSGIDVSDYIKSDYHIKELGIHKIEISVNGKQAVITISVEGMD